MTLNAVEAAEWASKLDAARRSREGRDPVSATVPLDLADAYAIQRAGTELRLQRGERVVGWKLGYTSLAMRAQMGIDQPNFGPLTDAMLLASNDAVSASLMQPRVEPEIGLRLARPLTGDVTVDDVLGAVGEAFACLEVVDSVFPGYRFRLEDNTADGSSAAQVVVGPALRRVDNLDLVTVVVSHNGRDVAASTGAAASGHPAAGVVWLVAQLARDGRQLEAGDIVITGGLTKAVPLGVGDHIEAVFDDEARAVVRRAA
ncbi:MAG TPA: fumarylacetoacetate hydrolase family protein [Ilumatobacteraceae bacterium]